MNNLSKAAAQGMGMQQGLTACNTKIYASFSMREVSNGWILDFFNPYTCAETFIVESLEKAFEMVKDRVSPSNTEETNQTPTL